MGATLIVVGAIAVALLGVTARSKATCLAKGIDVGQVASARGPAETRARRQIVERATPLPHGPRHDEAFRREASLRWARAVYT